MRTNLQLSWAVWIRLMPVLALPWSGAGYGAQGRPGTFAPDIGNHLGGFHIYYHYSGPKPTFRLDPETRSRSGAAMVRIDYTEKTKTMTGFPVEFPANRIARISFAAGADLREAEDVRVAMKCTDGKGGEVWFDLGEVPRTRQMQQIVTPILETPAFGGRNVVFVFATGAVGSVWFGDVRVEQVELDESVTGSLRPAGPTRWGVNDPLSMAYHKDPDDLFSDTSAKLMVACGFTHARVLCWWGSRDQLAHDLNAGGNWRAVDRKDGGGYDFADLEGYIAKLEHYGLRPAPVVVQGVPTWASGKTRDDLTPEQLKSFAYARRPFFLPRDWKDYEDFVFALVSHFKGRVHLWEVMNEPYLEDSAKRFGPEGYMEFLRRFSAQAKRADPECTVLCGQVAAAWLQRMLEIDPKIVERFDGLSSHPYTLDGAASRSAVRREQLILAAAGSPRPAYVTEVNWFGGVWKDDRPGDDLQTLMANKIRRGMALVAETSDLVEWWNSSFSTNRHGLLRDDQLTLTPMRQYWAMGEATGRLKREGGPVQVLVEASPPEVGAGQETVLRMKATNRSDRRVKAQLWPVGLVSSLTFDLKTVRTLEWEGALAPGESRTIEAKAQPAASATGKTFAVGLAALCPEGNTVTQILLKVGAIPQ